MSGPHQTARDQLIIQEAMKGVTNDDLGVKYGLTPQRVSTIVNNSPEAKTLHEKIADEFESMIFDATKTIRRVVNDDGDNNNSLKAASMILERVMGKVTEKLEARIEGKTQFITPEQVNMAQERLDQIKKKLGMEE